MKKYPPPNKNRYQPHTKTNKTLKDQPVKSNSGEAGSTDRIKNSPSLFSWLACDFKSLDYWAMLVARIVLGLVFAWFGVHELLQPRLWTGYVPILSPGSTMSILGVLGHGWVLVVLATALIFGIATRIASATAVIVMGTIILWLGIHGLNDVVVRDLGIFGLGLAVFSHPHSSPSLNRRHPPAKQLVN